MPQRRPGRELRLGALNNDMMKDKDTLAAVMKAVRTFREGLPLMIPVTLGYQEHQPAENLGVPLLLETFADRAYDDQGQLVSRRQAGAVHENPELIVKQALSFARKTVPAHRPWLDLPADSLRSRRQRSRP